MADRTSEIRARVEAATEADLHGHLADDCSRMSHGQCTTRRCAVRGGYSGGGSWDIETATCETYETSLLLQDIPWLLDKLEAAEAREAALREALGQISTGLHRGSATLVLQEIAQTALATKEADDGQV